MIDQVTKLRSIGVGSAILSGSSGVDKSLLASVHDVKVGGYSLLFCAPEAIAIGVICSVKSLFIVVLLF